MSSPESVSLDDWEWQPYQSFKLPPLAEISEPSRIAWQFFLQRIAQRLNALTFEYRFHDDGRLLHKAVSSSGQLTDPQQATYLHSPRFHYEQIRQVLLDLKLPENPPEYESAGKQSMRVSQKELGHQAIRFRLARMIWPSATLKDRNQAELKLRPEGAFLVLQKWVADRFADGSLVNAVQKWYQLQRPGSS